MKKLILRFTIGAVLLAILFTRYESLNHTYQTSLVTYPMEDRNFTFTKEPPEIRCRFGVQRPKGEMIRWHRLRLSFPFQAIIIDYQPYHGILQARGELDAIAVNLGCVAFSGFILSCVLLLRHLHRKQKSAERCAAGNGNHS
ncbi:MAG: hypothetical protein V4584_19055 [Verrucomicrobiota bacterium]